MCVCVFLRVCVYYIIIYNMSVTQRTLLGQNFSLEGIHIFKAQVSWISRDNILLFFYSTNNNCSEFIIIVTAVMRVI